MFEWLVVKPQNLAVNGWGLAAKPLPSTSQSCKVLAIFKNQNQHSEASCLFLRIFFLLLFYFYFFCHSWFFWEQHSHAPMDFEALVCGYLTNYVKGQYFCWAHTHYTHTPTHTTYTVCPRKKLLKFWRHFSQKVRGIWQYSFAEQHVVVF